MSPPLGRVDGFKEVLTILSSAAGPLWGGRDADGDDGGRLGGGCEAVSGLPLAAGRQGPQRPQVPRGAALFHGPQHHVAGAPGRVRQLEQHLETLLAAEPSDLGPDIAPRAAVGDKGYDAKANRAAARKRGICPVIPVKSSAKERPAFFPKALYRA